MDQLHAVTPSHTLSDNLLPGLVRKPRSSAGGRRHGFHLAAAMGLEDTDGAKKYNMVLVCINSLQHANTNSTASEYRSQPHTSWFMLRALISRASIAMFPRVIS